ncbi:phosphatase PAP2 family protein [Streptomyces sp. XM83C]|uniref:Bifunctional glycosyltransferase 87/phosphatase PAP2 family protein n=1 Tax=Streptomyces thermocoprophilus TaxID=78356 RepID=A0ABV5VK68_9ACTN|nr:bifunctional glycosyltransferase 87/phosphatase PAP2 family protein [Streptomyces sp. XM83C]MCK1823458.1 phosphatase PAP2 family protein [Streptomyces sp. XM83C]
MANARHSGHPERAFGATAVGAAGARVQALRLVLWLVAALLAAREVESVLGSPPGRRLTDLETWVGPDGVLHVKGSLYDSDAFTGTPFGGLVLKPLTRAAEQALGWGWTFGTLLLVVALGLIAARALPQPVSRRTSLLAAPVAVSLLMLSLPVRNTLYLGQTSIIPVLLVVAGCFAVRGERAAGVCVGVAAAFQPTVLLFTPLLWLTGRRTAALSAGATFAACTLAAWVAMPRDSATYWVHHLAGAGLGGPADDLANQSLHGALLRLGLSGPPEIALFLLLSGVVAVLGVRRAVRYARDGQLLLAVAVTGCAAVAISPTAWQHQLLWLLLAVVGRVGRRAADRFVWPVAVILVMTLPASMIVPGKPLFQPLIQNLALLASVAAATAVPFLLRTSPYFRDPVPNLYAPTGPEGGARSLPFLPQRAAPVMRRALTRPNLLFELLLIRVTYAAYAQIRLAAAGDSSTAGRARAEEHGRQILDLERLLHIDIEHWANHAVVAAGRVEDFLSFYYESFHFGVPLAILGVLYWRRPVDYRWARSAIGIATVLALAGFWLYPLAPPRLMPELGIVDTVNGPQDFSRPDYGTLTELTNQYAAMPSLHFGWALWCGLVIVVVAPRGWMKALGLLHPFFTLCAIVGTGNHWVLDAVGGAAVVGVGFGLTHLFQGPRAAPGSAPATAEPAPVSGATAAPASATPSAATEPAAPADRDLRSPQPPSGSPQDVSSAPPDRPRGRTPN